MITTPDFASHAWVPLARAEAIDGLVVVAWVDAFEFRCHPFWLYEQSVGIEERTREGTVEPGVLASRARLLAVRLGTHGSLELEWGDGETSSIHPGWLRHIADDEHLPRATIGEPKRWTAADFAEPPTVDAGAVLDDQHVVEAWLDALCTFGVARLSGTPADDDFLEALAARIGPVRGSNFGGVFTVESVADPDSTANTGLALGQHTDLPTRETPPGFQFLHCIENTVRGGYSRLADGYAVVAELEQAHPDAHDSLMRDEWVFANRAIDGDHRWIGPIIDRGGPRAPLTIRAFYPVRLAPHMPLERQAAAYDAMRVFSQVAHDPRFMITFPFQPGDLVGFDNRRVLHGRDAFDPTAGRRRLQGCYIDHDDVFSRLRVLRRPAAPQPTLLESGPST